ncbi:MAG: hypothetical protein ABI091_07965, partial [Ferruginibacter sp.]
MKKDMPYIRIAIGRVTPEFHCVRRGKHNDDDKRNKAGAKKNLPIKKYPSKAIAIRGTLLLNNFRTYFPSQVLFFLLMSGNSPLGSSTTEVRGEV